MISITEIPPGGILSSLDTNPATCNLTAITIRLPRRITDPHDPEPTLKTIEFESDDHPSSKEYKLAAKQALHDARATWNGERVAGSLYAATRANLIECGLMSSATSTATLPVVELAEGRNIGTCPSCGGENALVYSDGYRCPGEWDGSGFSHDPLTVQIDGRCMRGCSSESIASAILKLVRFLESKNATAAITSERDQLAASASVTRAPASVTEWLIPGLVPARALSIWVAPTEHMKTWIMIHAAICIAGGIPWLGRPAKRSRVMLCLLESREINEARIEYIARGLGTTRQALADWLFVYPAEMLKTDDAASCSQLAQFLRVLHIEALLIDNLKKIRSSHTQSAANDEAIMASVIVPLESLAQHGSIHGHVIGHKVAVVVLAHGDDGRVRGSSGVPEHADWMMGIDRRGGKHESPITIDRAPGCRLLYPDAKVSLRFRGVMPDPVIPELVERESKSTDTTTEPEKSLRDRIYEHLETTPSGTNELLRMVGGSKTILVAELKSMVADGLIEKRDDGLFHTK